jgi:hypothetical protein
LRRASLALLALLVVLASWCWDHQQGYLGYAAPLLRPADYDGREVILSLVRVESVLDDGYVVRAGRLLLSVAGDPRGVSPGEEVSVGGRWSAAEARLVEQWREPRPGRKGKKILGLIGLAVTVGLVPLAVRFRRGGWGVGG